MCKTNQFGYRTPAKRRDNNCKILRNISFWLYKITSTRQSQSLHIFSMNWTHSSPELWIFSAAFAKSLINLIILMIGQPTEYVLQSLRGYAFKWSSSRIHIFLLVGFSVLLHRYRIKIVCDVQALVYTNYIFAPLVLTWPGSRRADRCQLFLYQIILAGRGRLESINSQMPSVLLISANALSMGRTVMFFNLRSIKSYFVSALWIWCQSLVE